MTDPILPDDLLPTYSEARAILAVIVALAAVSTGAGLLNATSTLPSEVVAGFVLLLGGNSASAITFLLLRKGLHQAAGLLIVLACGAITTTLMILGLGLHDVALIGFPLVVLIAGLILRRHAITVSLLVSVSGLGLVAALEHLGLVASPAGQVSSIVDLLSVLMNLIAVAVFVRMLVGGFRQALGHALASERALVISNRELEARAARLEAQEIERIRLISDLEAKNAKLEQFTYTVSHDLKTPLITIRTYVDSIGQDLDRGQHGRVRDDLRRVSAASNKMRELLDGLRDLSPVRVLGAIEDVPLRTLVEEAVALPSVGLAARGVVTVVAPSLPMVRVDRQRILDVFATLLDNAARFMGDQAAPRVEIDTQTVEGRVVVRVRDNGIGIEPRHQEKVFGLFERLDPVHGGAGIGLTVARRIVEAHGGRLWVESDGAGRGSTFFFSVSASPLVD